MGAGLEVGTGARDGWAEGPVVGSDVCSRLLRRVSSPAKPNPSTLTRIMSHRSLLGTELYASSNALTMASWASWSTLDVLPEKVI